MKLTLTDDDGVVVTTWSIGHKLDFDPEDLNASGDHDFYTVVGWESPDDIGHEIWNEVLRAKKRGLV